MSELPLTTRAALTAIDRSVAGTASEDHETCLMAAGQALFWACALDEQLKQAPGYSAARTEHPSGRLMPGLRLARNSIAHGATVIVFPAQGVTFPMTWPVIWQQPRWADYPTIRGGLNKDPSPHDRHIWETWITGRNVPAILHDVHDWLSTAAGQFQT